MDHFKAPEGSPTRPDVGDLAPLSNRLIGGVLDLLAMGFGGGIARVATMGLVPGASAEALALGSVVGMASTLALNSVLLFNEGTSIGKLFVGTRVVRLDGEPLDAWRVFLRVWAFPLLNGLSQMTLGLGGPLLVDSLAIFAGRRRCLHDYLVGTVVVLAAEEPPT